VYVSIAYLMTFDQYVDLFPTYIFTPIYRFFSKLVFTFIEYLCNKNLPN